MDAQEVFLNTLLSDLEDVKFDIEMDLGPDSVPYEKIKSVLENVQDYQESLT